jgi:hypothetical protein
MGCVLDPFIGTGTLLMGAGPSLAPDDLRHPLVAHIEDAGDGGHWQAVLIGGADGRVAFLA